MVRGACVDRHGDAGDIAGLVGGQIQHSVADVERVDRIDGQGVVLVTGFGDCLLPAGDPSRVAVTVSHFGDFGIELDAAGEDDLLVEAWWPDGQWFRRFSSRTSSTQSCSRARSSALSSGQRNTPVSRVSRRQKRLIALDFSG